MRFQNVGTCIYLRSILESQRPYHQADEWIRIRSLKVASIINISSADFGSLGFCGGLVDIPCVTVFRHGE